VRYLMGKSHVVAVHKTHERSRNLKRKKWPAARDQRVEASHRIQATDGGQKVGLQSESLNVDLGHAVVQVQRSRVEVPPVPPANHKATIATRVALALTEKNEIEVQKKNGVGLECESAVPALPGKQAAPVCVKGEAEVEGEEEVAPA